MKQSWIGLAACAAVAPMAGADICSWNWNRNDPGHYGINDAAGHWSSVQASYDTNSMAFSWAATFENTVTNGFWLAVSPGDNPKGHAGELALMYADFSTPGNPILTVYAYNGVNGDSSYFDGDNAAGVQAPDRIASTHNGFAAGMSLVDNAGRRTLSISFNAAAINAHVPLYDSDQNEWTGVAFGTQPPPRLGLWMHTVKGLDAEYDSDGYLKNWSYDSQGWFDGRDFHVNCVPAPAATGLLAFAGLFAGRRRR